MVSCLFFARAGTCVSLRFPTPPCVGETARLHFTGKKTPGGAGTHTGHTGHTGARGHTDHTDEPHNHPLKSNDTPARKPRPTQQPQEQPQARSRPLPAADSEEAAPGEPDPASCLHPLTLYGIGVGSPKFCIHNVNEKRGAADCRRAPCSFIVQFAVKGACRRLRAARIW